MSDYNFKEDFEKISDQELQVYIDQRQKYIPEAVEAAIEELQKRGRVFSEEELISIRSEIQIKIEQEKTREEKGEPLFSKKKYAITDNPDAPEFYSQRVIYIFSILFSTFFASILMAMNLARTEAKKGIAEVILFGVVFTALIAWIGSLIPNSNFIGILLNGLGGAILNTLFWNKYIGKETEYRTRAYWPPLVIGLSVCALIFYAIFNGVRV